MRIQVLLLWRILLGVLLWVVLWHLRLLLLRVCRLLPGWSRSPTPLLHLHTLTQRPGARSSSSSATGPCTHGPPWVWLLLVDLLLRLILLLLLLLLLGLGVPLCILLLVLRALCLVVCLTRYPLTLPLCSLALYAVLLYILLRPIPCRLIVRLVLGPILVLKRMGGKIVVGCAGPSR
jgi:hypothetical protein